MELTADKNKELFTLLAGGAEPDQANYEGKTALHLACGSGWYDAVSTLLMYGADANHCDKNATTPLHFASWENHLDCVYLLLRYGADSDLAEGEGWTALHDAVRREYTDIIFAILRHSRNVRNIETAKEKTGKCSGDERFLTILKLLAENQVALNSVGICGQSLLHDAVERGYTQSVEYFMEHGGNANLLALNLGEIRFEGTPLHKASAFNRKEIYKLLLSSGGDESVKNINGKTPPEIWGIRGAV